VIESIRGTLSLLDPRSRRILWLLIIAQMLLAFLDMAGVLLFGLVAALSASAISGEDPALIADILDRLGLAQSDEISLAIGFAVFAGALFVVKSVTSFILVRRAYRFLAARQAIIASRLASRLLTRPLQDVQRRSSQKTAFSLVQGVNAATMGVLGGSVIVAAETAVLVVLAIGLVVVDPAAALFTLAFFALIGWLLQRILGNWASRWGRQLSLTDIASITSVQNAVRTYREVSVTGRQAVYVDHFRKLRWEAARVQANVQVMNQVSKYVFEIAFVLGAGLLAVSQFLTRDAIAAVAVIAVFLTAATRIMPALLRLQGALLGIRSRAGAATPTLELAEELPEIGGAITFDSRLRDQLESGMRAGYPGFVAEVQMERVSLTYPEAERPAAQQVSLRVPVGHSLALAGPTGAGKSTVADLILGVLHPQEGRVSISGMKPSEAAQTWPGAIAYVPQDITVIDGTVRDNVALGLPADIVDDDLVWDALERAHLAQMVLGDQGGLDLIVGENGVCLSGGQRQRLGLARALYTRPKLIVLDEATSALDSETEQIISKTLESLGREVTMVIIAHRLATIRHCDAVVYLEEGRMLSNGTFDEVRAEQPNFDRQASLLGL